MLAGSSMSPKTSSCRSGEGDLDGLGEGGRSLPLAIFSRSPSSHGPVSSRSNGLGMCIFDAGLAGDRPRNPLDDIGRACQRRIGSNNEGRCKLAVTCPRA